jgi:hypothetical protein
MSSLAGPLTTGAVRVDANPFSRRAVLAIVLLGAALFVALLWMIGSGSGMGSANNGGAHAGSKGLTGYAAMADYLDRRGYAVSTVRNEGALRRPGLLVLAPPAGADGGEIENIVSARRYIGPTLVITPKWLQFPAAGGEDGAKKGWVRLHGIQPPQWRGFLDQLTVFERSSKQSGARWRAMALSGRLPDGKHIQAGAGTGLVQLVAGPHDTETLAGFMDDGGSYPGLEAIARDRVLHSSEGNNLYPLIIVFEPDLLNNYGMADFANARLAETLTRASGVQRGGAVVFDLTLNGLGRSDNLLTLAFTPPFLAATLCLILAAVLVGWRAFLRFGPPLASDRAIAFGKRALVANSAGLVRRSGRLHLLARPYADRTRDNLIRALGMPRALDAAQAGEAIDRVLAARHPGAEPFTAVSARLTDATRPHDLLTAARDLNALERMLTR